MKIQVKAKCAVTLKNNAEVCLDSIYPTAWIWQFTEDKDEDTITGLKFDKKTKIVNHNVERPFICKV